MTIGDNKFHFRRICIDCGLKFEPKGRFQKYCLECIKKRMSEARKKYYKNNRTKQCQHKKKLTKS